jgi:hypothetical protein
MLMGQLMATTIKLVVVEENRDESNTFCFSSIITQRSIELKRPYFMTNNLHRAFRKYSRSLNLFHSLLCYSLNLKFIKLGIHTIPHNVKVKLCCFSRIVYNLITIEKLKCFESISIQPLWYGKLKWIKMCLTSHIISCISILVFNMIFYDYLISVPHTYPTWISNTESQIPGRLSDASQRRAPIFRWIKIQKADIEYPFEHGGIIKHTLHGV